jgi:cyclic lactone autoinducer peptide
MKTIKSYIIQMSKIVAPLALALAVLTANSTCICFTNQPKEPDSLRKYKIDKHS